MTPAVLEMYARQLDTIRALPIPPPWASSRPQHHAIMANRPDVAHAVRRELSA